MAAAVTRGYHVLAIPTVGNRVRILTDWALDAALGPPLVDVAALGPQSDTRNGLRPTCPPAAASRHDEAVAQRNVLGNDLEPCGTDPVTGFFRDGCCRTGPEDVGSHTICAVVTVEFLDHQRSIGNDLTTPMPQYRFPGLVPGDRWCVTALNWARAYEDGAAAPVVLASTHEAVLQIVPLALLREHAVDVPDDPGAL